MRIVHIISHLGYGGAEKMLYEELRSCKVHEHEHRVIYIKRGIFLEKIEALGIRTYHLSGMILRYDPFIYYRLKALLRAVAPDVIHASLWAANLLARYAGRALNIPVINDIHGNVGQTGWLRRTIDRFTVVPGTSFVTVSTTVKASVERYLPAVPAHALTVIPNGVTTEYTLHKSRRERGRSSLQLSPDAFIIGSIGRLHRIKGYDLLIQSFARLPAMIHEQRATHTLRVPKLLLVGDGPDRTRLHRLAKKLGVEQDVIFAGYQDKPHEWYRLFDCFVLPSHSEGLSLALLEAMSFGIPVITTHDQQCHDVIVHGEHGLLVTKNNHHELSAALMEFYREPEKAKRLGQNGCKRVVTSFTLDDMVRTYDKLYQTVVNR
jgi:glycosyltransferase involved in cell wall biosynthesis